MAKRKFKQQPLADLIWLAVGFLVLQLCLGQGIERWLPRVRDPHYTVRAAKLDNLIAKNPKAPLVVMIGSSRTQLGLQGGRLSRKAESANAEVFNFGIPASGPIAQLVCLRRLLDHGVRPELLLIELTPPFLSQRGNKPMEEEMLDASRLELAELRRIETYYDRPWRLWSPWLMAQCLASSRRRAELRPQLALDAAKPWTASDDPFQPMDDHGWLPMMMSATEEQRRKLTGLAYQQYRGALQEFELSQGAVQALRDILALCRQRDIPTAL